MRGAPHRSGPPSDGGPPAEALVVVDVQRAFLTGPVRVPGADGLLGPIRDLVHRARAGGALVVQLQNDGPPGSRDEPGTPGWELCIPPDPARSGLEVVVRKASDDGFEGTPLGAILAEAGVRSLAICGVQSEMCVLATARTALRRGLHVRLPHDAHGTYDIPASATSDAVPARQVVRVAEWALGDEVEIVARAAEVAFAPAARPARGVSG